MAFCDPPPWNLRMVICSPNLPCYAQGIKPEPAPDTSWIKEVDIRYDGKPRKHRPRWLRKATTR